MSLNGLLTALTAEVEAEAERRLAEARAEASRLRAEADAAIERTRSAALAAREAELRKHMERELADARRRARIETLESRRRMLDGLRTAARARLGAIARDGMDDSMRARHVEEALAYIGDEPAVVRCPPEWTRVARRVTEERTSVRVEVEDALTGVQVVARDGALLVNNTLEGRLDRLWPVLAIEILHRTEAVP